MTSPRSVLPGQSRIGAASCKSKRLPHKPDAVASPRRDHANWNDIRLFLAAARAGSTLGASKHQGVAQSTVSRRLAALEGELGLPLFGRETRGFRPTRDGARLHALDDPLGAAFARVEADLAALPRPAKAQIRVTAPAEAMHYRLMPTLEAFRARHDGVQFEIDTSEGQLDLSAGDADLVLRLVDEIDDDRLIARRVGHARWGVDCPRRHYGAEGAPRGMEEIAGHDIVHYADAAARRAAPVRWFGERIDVARVIMRVGAVPAMVSALRSSGGLGERSSVVGDRTPDLPLPAFSLDLDRLHCHGDVAQSI